MARLEVIVLCLKIAIVLTHRYEKPVPKALWPQHCNKNSHALNDCNWCWCNEKHVFACHARVCNTVDMFGHFNDAIQDIDVGMEGHGVWRSNKTACEPGVQYQRQSLLCICDENGNWPNAVCRDTFRILHAVELVGKQNKAKRCVATRLYVVGCNVCYCPSTGRIDSDLCTKRNCTKDDPVLHKKKVMQPEEIKSQEFYAECSQGQEYKIGCRKCSCLSSNRLLCDECTEEISVRAHKEGSHYCSNVKPGQIFSMDCNLCFCDRKHVIYCTTKQCINGPSKYYVSPSLFRTSNLVAVSAPYDDLDCTPGTKYIKGCNICYCSRADDGTKVYSCTVKDCDNDNDNSNTALDNIKAGCVKSQVYKLNCLICRCDVVDEIKRETCKLDTKCTDDKAVQEARSDDLGSLRGYCEPYHNYNKDCNTCRCLADGKVVECTPNVCNVNEKKPIAVDIVPVSQSDGEPCSKNRMYKVECNVCFCLSSGNVLCTTIDCNKKG